MSLQSLPIQKRIKLLSQGSYGCIIRPSITCSGKINNTDKYITKIQKKKATSNRETTIGKTIQAIPNYSHYFAPVIETCDINMGIVDANEIKKCEFIKTGSTNNTYSSNKILYVGKHSLADYLLDVFQKTPKVFFREVLRTYKDLLLGLSKLNDAGIIHFDLRENNIMCRDKDGKPIIIDFGLSLTQDILQMNKKSGFFVYAPDYASWCFDISFVCYLVQYMKETDVVMMSVLVKLVDDFISKNDAVITLLSKDDQDSYKINLLEFVKQFENRSVGNAIRELYLYQKSWDNYSMSVIFLTIMKTMEIPPSPIVDKFVTFLKTIVLSMPDKRLLPKQSKQNIESIFSVVPLEENKKLVQVLHRESDDVVKNEKRRTNLTRSMMMDLKREETMGFPPYVIAHG